MKKLNTIVKHKLCDGTEVDCTITMAKVLTLASKNKELHKLMARTIAVGTEDIFEMVRFVYGAYLCANLENEDVLSEEDFIEKCGADYKGIVHTMTELITPKK